MGDIVLITGGSRSGKSALAQHLAEALPGPRTFVATCPVGDDTEITERLRRHREARAGAGWATLEEPIEVAAALRRAPAGGVSLVDCLTLWVSNLLWRAVQQAEGAAAGAAGVAAAAAADALAGAFSEDDMRAACRALVAASREVPGVSLFVTNEVGLGVVPENAVARRYRDLVGRCNQIVAATADVVVLTVCGLPLVVKGADHPLGSLAAALSYPGTRATGDRPTC
jgi:adenosylcobinamide kinase/adenosylcobinamide-phosphate guanylyltransferase